MSDALQKLCKWRSVFAGWQLGTRTREDPEGQAVRDHREVTILLRAEVNAFTALLVQKGVFTVDELRAQLDIEAGHLDRMYEKKFPGARTSLDGVHIDIRAAQGWLSKFRP